MGHGHTPHGLHGSLPVQTRHQRVHKRCSPLDWAEPVAPFGWGHVRTEQPNALVVGPPHGRGFWHSRTHAWRGPRSHAHAQSAENAGPKVARLVVGRVGECRSVLGRGARSAGRPSGGPHSKRPPFPRPALLGHERRQGPVARGVDAGLGGLHGGHQRGQGRGRTARVRRGRQPRTQSLGHGQCARGVLPKLSHHWGVFPHRGHRAIRRPNARHRLDCGGGGGLDLGLVDPPVSPFAQRRACGRGSGGRGWARGPAIPAQALAPRQVGGRCACHHLPRHPRGELAHGHWRRGDPRVGLVDQADDDPSPRCAGQRPWGAPECGTFQGCGGCA